MDSVQILDVLLLTVTVFALNCGHFIPNQTLCTVRNEYTNGYTHTFYTIFTLFTRLFNYTFKPAAAPPFPLQELLEMSQSLRKVDEHFVSVLTFSKI